MPDLTILHTNDLHGKLSDRAAERIAREKSTAEHCLLLDGGDATPSGNIYYRPGGEPILARMSELGYDAMAMGNREFHFLGPGLKSKVKLARFPILCANLHSELELGQLVVPSVVFEIGMKVGVFGLTVPMITKRMMVSKLSPFWFEDPIQAAAKMVHELKPKTDLLIALTHIGLKADMELAQSVPGIDIIVGGHTHAVLDKPVVVGETSIVQAGAWGRFLGRVDVSGTRISGRLIDLAE